MAQHPANAVSTSVTAPPPLRADAIRWELLSRESQAILRQVLVPIHMEGDTVAETAKRLQIPHRAVALLTAFFASEVRELGRAVSDA
jgi:hypothetical protein